MPMFLSMAAALPSRRGTLLGAGLLAAALFHLAHTTFQLGGGLAHELADVWVYNGLVLAAAGACFVRALRSGSDRPAWLAIGLGLVCWTACNVGCIVLDEPMSRAGWTRITYALHGGFYFGMLTGLLILVRARIRGRRAMLWVDGAIAVLAAAAVWTAFVLDPVAARSGDTSTVLALAYPLADLVLLALVCAAGAVTGWRLGPSVLLLATAFGVAAVADSATAYLLAAGSDEIAETTTSLWLVSMLLIAAAAGARQRPVEPREAGWQALAVPAGFGALGLALAAAHHTLGFGMLTWWLSVATVALALARGAAAIAQHRRELRRAEAAREALLVETEKLRRSETRLDETNRLAGLGHWEWDLESDRIVGSRQLFILFGLDPETPWVGIDTYLGLVEDGDRDRVAAIVADGIENGTPFDYEAHVLRADGERRIFHIRGGRTALGGPMRLVGTAHDVTEQKAADVALRESSAKVARTERFLRTVLGSLSEGVVTLDASGHITTANAAATRMLAREEGDLRQLTLHAALHRERSCGSECSAEALRLTDAPRSLEDLAIGPDGTEVAVALSAVPFESDAGRGVVVTFRDVTRQKEEEARLRADLESLTAVARTREALESGRLVLYAQPIVDLATGDLIEEELLIRMIGEDGSIVPPAAFLPAAEQHGFITQIDRWVIAEGARLARDGRRVALNLSAASIGDIELADWIERTVREAGADPACITFEITETALTSDMAAATEFAARLTRRGFGLALDDFGTGYASFSYLKRLPLSFLKIDREFVRGLGDDPANERLVSAVVRLAGDFGLRTIAEGVEDEDTLARLRRLGVDLAQGFLFGRPRRAEGAAEGTATAEGDLATLS